MKRLSASSILIILGFVMAMPVSESQAAATLSKDANGCYYVSDVAFELWNLFGNRVENGTAPVPGDPANFNVTVNFVVATNINWWYNATISYTDINGNSQTITVNWYTVNLPRACRTADYTGNVGSNLTNLLNITNWAASAPGGGGSTSGSTSTGGGVPGGNSSGSATVPTSLSSSTSSSGS